MSQDIPAAKMYFGKIATEYDIEREHEPLDVRDQEIVESILDKFPRGTSLLDVPAGTGKYIKATIDRGIIYKGVDVSDDMIKQAHLKLSILGDQAENVDLRVSDARKLPFEDNSIDYILSVKFIKYLSTLQMFEDVLKEFERVVKIGAFIQVETRTTMKSHIIHFLSSIKTMVFKTIPITRTYSHDDVKEVVSRTNFFIQEIIINKSGNSQRRFYFLKKK